MRQRKKERLIFWDWAGTLADEAKLDQAICEEIEKAISGQRLIPLREAKQIFRHYLRQLENKWEWHDYARHGRMFNLPWEKIQELYLDKLRLVPGAREILLWAKETGYRNLLATNAVRVVVSRRLDYLKISSLFDAVITSDDVGHLKSHGFHFRRGLELFPAQPEDCFSIGDNPTQDIAPARKLGLKTIHCVFGPNLTHFHTSHISANPQEEIAADFTVFSLGEIKNVLTEQKT